MSLGWQPVCLTRSLMLEVKIGHPLAQVCTTLGLHNLSYFIIIVSIITWTVSITVGVHLNSGLSIPTLQNDFLKQQQKILA